MPSLVGTTIPLPCALCGAVTVQARVVGEEYEPHALRLHLDHKSLYCATCLAQWGQDIKELRL